MNTFPLNTWTRVPNSTVELLVESTAGRNVALNVRTAGLWVKVRGSAVEDGIREWEWGGSLPDGVEVVLISAPHLTVRAHRVVQP